MMGLLREVLARLVALEQRVAQLVQVGTVHEVDAAKGRYRLRQGGTDDKPFLGPWTPYSQMAGALKIHAPPSVGQQMMQINASGDPRIGVGIPYTWSDANQSPNNAGDQNTITFESWRVTLRGDALDISGPKIKVTGDVEIVGNTDFKAGTVAHDGTNIGKDHKHSGVRAGGDTTGDPV